MNDNFTQLVSSAQGEGPSDEFREFLRAEVVARSERPAAPNPRPASVVALDKARPHLGNGGAQHAELEVTFGDGELANRPKISRKRPRGPAAAAAALLVAAGIGFWVLNQTDESPLDTVDISTTTIPNDAQPDDVDRDLITNGGVSIDDGSFLVDSLGTELRFSIDALQIVSANRNGHFSFAPFTSRNVDDRMLSFRRVPFLPDPSTPTKPMSFTDGWPASDLDGWVANLADDVVASEVAKVEFGGADALFVALSFGCDSGSNCLPPTVPSEGFQPVFNAGSTYRLWVVDQGETDPIVVTAAIDQDGDSQWFEEAETVLDTIEFGPVADSPVRLERAGTVEFDVFDGVRFDLEADVLVVEPYVGFARVLASPLGSVEMLTRPLDTSGSAVTSTDQIIGFLRDEAVVVDELPPVIVDGVPARVLRINSGRTPDILLKTRPAELARNEYGWEPPCCAYLWIFEHPARGLLIISAQRPAEFDADPELLRSWVESMLGSLEFVDG